MILMLIKKLIHILPFLNCFIVWFKKSWEAIFEVLHKSVGFLNNIADANNDSSSKIVKLQFASPNLFEVK
jgi:hypothetical protein